MRPVPRRVVLAIALSALFAVAGGPVAAAPAPSFSIAMTVNMDGDPACIQTANATWKNTRIDLVTLSWYQGWTWLVATGTAPGTGPNDGAIKGKKAIFPLEVRVIGPPPTDWRLVAQFFSGGVLRGEAVLETWSLCAV